LRLLFVYSCKQPLPFTAYANPQLDSSLFSNRYSLDFFQFGLDLIEKAWAEAVTLTLANACDPLSVA
jgi:hypothetical protein